MALVSGDPRLFGTFASHHPKLPSGSGLSSSSSSSAPSKIHVTRHLRSSNLEIAPKWPSTAPVDEGTRHKHFQCSAITRNDLSSATINHEVDGFLLNAIRMSFFERLSLVWKILFPTERAKRNSNANIAKQRLKMILFSDRCAVSDEAKQKIVRNIVEALSDFVEIDSQEKVQLNVSADPDLGTVYSVTVPVRRVKPEYQESDDDYLGITSIKYKDTGEKSGTVDVKFDFFIPNEQ